MMTLGLFLVSAFLVMMMYVIAPIFVGLAYASLIEYLAHWLILHIMGRKKDSFFAHHWFGHHRTSRLSKFMDLSYLKGWTSWDKHGREVFSVLSLIVVNTLIFWQFDPIFTITSNVYALCYLYYHRRMHLNPDWGRSRFPWHYDHHMGQNQNLNWGVLTPVWDNLFNTRQKYTYDRNGKATKVS